jgi:quinol monooxygenase YgiN
LVLSDGSQCGFLHAYLTNRPALASTPKENKMATMFVRHTVNDYNHWKSVYDEFASVRQENGVTGASVHRDAQNPNVIIVTHQFKDVNAAMAFADSEELKSAMADAGVAGPPEIWFTEDVEQTAY